MPDSNASPSRTYDVAIAGATGAVGEVLIELLAERGFPVGRVVLLASERSAGQRLGFGGRQLRVERLDDFDFAGVDFAFFSAGGEVSGRHAPRAAEAGAVVIDNTSRFRLDDAVPLIVPEVNGAALDEWRANTRGGGIIANPNCSTIQMVVALAPLHRAARVRRIHVSTYQAVSGAGRRAVEELGRQTADRLNFRDPEAKVFDQPIAFNVLPRIDVLDDNGYTREEMKMHNETRKILGDKEIAVHATAVRVPVFYGHSEAVHAELERALELDEILGLLREAPGVVLHEGTHPTPLRDGAGTDGVHVGRVRRDHSSDCGVAMWVVSDNLRKGAALNALQIAERLVENDA
ncbi:MAG: aspartate-semialdehyde dehydrogenase [Wenzhouxiangellaceae bacterium]|nr:aspartate-semialdehyde dehydrogenase [Wenzhouxiangellaceae bacterium]